MITKLEKWNKFLQYIDVPTKLHLQEFKDNEGLQEYRILRTELEDDLIILELIKRDPGELGFVMDLDTYEDYLRTYTDIDGDPEDAVFTREEFTLLKKYFQNK